MKKKTMVGLIAIVAIVVVAIFTGCVEEEVNTYNKFGFLFEYPADMEVFEENASEEAGYVILGKPGVALDVWWRSAEDINRSSLWEIFGAYLAGSKVGHKFYLGDTVEEKVNGHKAWDARFCTEEEEGVLLNVAGSWYCDKSKKVFIVRSAAKWDDPKFVMVFRVGEKGIPKTEPDWPDLKKDPSYKVYKKVISSFRCH